MHTTLRTFFLHLLALSWSCVGFNFTSLPSQVFAGNVTEFQWNWNKSNSRQSPSGSFLALLVVPPNNFQCARQLDNSGLGFDTAKNIMDGLPITASNPINGTETSGTLLFTPQKIGTHFICAYGNISLNATSDSDDSKFSRGKQQGGQFDPSEMEAFLRSLIFLDQSNTFEVVAGAGTNSTPSSSTTSTSSSPSNTASPSPSTMNDKDRSWHHGRNDPGIAPIVGGVVGGVALILLLLLIFFYRRLRYQRKLNQFHKEHMLLQQKPPPSLHSSTGASTLVPRFTSPPMATSSLPLAPNRRSDVPPGLEETMQKSYRPLSEDHHSTPSSYTIPLPNEHGPVFHAQHGPGLQLHHDSNV